MEMYKIGFVLLLVGIPACSGAYFMTRYFGSKRTSAGAYLLTFAILVVIVLFIYPLSRIDSVAQPLLAFWIFIATSLIGAATGMLLRHKSK